jgi:hypothetical protein
MDEKPNLKSFVTLGVLIPVIYLLAYLVVNCSQLVHRGVDLGIRMSGTCSELTYYTFYPLFWVESAVTTRVVLLEDESGGDRSVIDVHDSLNNAVFFGSTVGESVEPPSRPDGEDAAGQP